jgi:hypothetical protein
MEDLACLTWKGRKGVITEKQSGVRHMAGKGAKEMGYNGNGEHIIYGRLTWKGAGQMSEGEEGPKETGPVSRSSGEWMAGEENGNRRRHDRKGAHVNTTPFRTPPPPY